MAKILVALESRDLAWAVKAALEARDFVVVLAPEGVAALSAIRREQPDLIIAGLLLPGLTGLDIWRHLASDPGTSAVPVVILTGRARDPDTVVGVAVGPGEARAVRFEFAELVRTVEAVLARSPPRSAAVEMVRAGPVTVDLRRRRVTVHAQTVRLTSREFSLLRALLDARGRVQTREDLLEAVWGAAEVRPARVRAVDVYIRRLRMKLAAGGQQIVTVRHVGYRFAVAVEWITFGGELPGGSAGADPGTAGATKRR